ncbi:hypothetical protein EOM39_03385 [Candidatus Gracilibacteria bacterium]|nr:hypothetical protein [Candidatus Gracilibacteria bacterium]
MDILRIPTHYAMQITYMSEIDKSYIFDTLMRLSIGEEIDIEKSMRGGIILSIWTESVQLENKALSKKGKSLKIDIAPMGQPNLKNIATKSNQIKSNQIKSNQIITSKDVTKDESFGNEEINDIIKAIKDNHGLVDGPIQEQRRYGKLLRDKISKLDNFNGDFYHFIDFIIKNSDEYRVGKTTSPKKIYYSLAELIANIKTKIPKDIPRC